jgi:hypothetical protein
MPSKEQLKFACPHCATKFDVQELAVHIDSTKCGVYLREHLGKQFRKNVDVKEPTKAQAAARSEALLVQDKKGNTALKMSGGSEVIYIPYSSDGLEVRTLRKVQFDTQYKGSPEYPPGRAAMLYLEFAQLHGATEETLNMLATLVDVPSAVRKRALEAMHVQETTSDTTKIVKAQMGSARAEVIRKPRRSAAAMFQDLIMKGLYTDDEIFEQVQEAFDLPESKRRYVQVYRSRLRTKGMNPPPRRVHSVSEARPSQLKDIPAPPPKPLR